MKRFVIAVLAIVLVFAGCSSGQSKTSATATPSPTPTGTPVPPDIVFSGPEAMGDAVEKLADLETEATGVVINRLHTNEGTAMAYCITGKTDIAMLTREVKAQEKDTYDNVKSTLLCTQAFAVIAGADCPVDSLTVEQLKKIFTGDAKNWSDVGGSSGEIKVYAMSSSSATGEAFEYLVLGKDESGTQVKIDENVCTVLDTAADVGAIIGQNSLAIGFIPLVNVSSYSVKALSIEGVEPSEANVKNGTYKLQRPFNLVTIGNVDEKTAKFIEFCTTSSDAKAYLTEQGYILP